MLSVIGFTAHNPKDSVIPSFILRFGFGQNCQILDQRSRPGEVVHVPTGFCSLLHDSLDPRVDSAENFHNHITPNM